MQRPKHVNYAFASGERFERFAEDGSNQPAAIGAFHGVTGGRRAHEQIEHLNRTIHRRDLAEYDANNCKENFIFRADSSTLHVLPRNPGFV